MSMTPCVKIEATAAKLFVIILGIKAHIDQVPQGFATPFACHMPQIF